MSDVKDSAAQHDAPLVTIEVPAEHMSLFQRIKALVERDEQWIVDNIHAGIVHFEKMVGDPLLVAEAVAIEVKDDVEDTTRDADVTE